MDVKESIKKLIEQSTELLKKLEANGDVDESDDIDGFDQIVDESKEIAAQLKTRRKAKPHQRNGNKSPSVEPMKIKLVPIDRLTRVSDDPVELEKSSIEANSSDNDVTNDCDKPKSSGTVAKAAKSNILKNVFSHSKENIATKRRATERLPLKDCRTCSIKLKRINLNSLATSSSAVKPSSQTVRCENFLFCIVCVCVCASVS